MPAASDHGTGHTSHMWSDDPWAREHADQARQLAGLSLAHQLEDIVRRARSLAQSSDPQSALAFWQSVAASRAHAEMDDIVRRLSTLCARVWSTVT